MKFGRCCARGRARSGNPGLACSFSPEKKIKLSRLIDQDSLIAFNAD